MKFHSRLPVLLLGLGAAAVLQAQEVNVNIPGQSAQAAPATASTPAPATPQQFTDDQLVETMGWFVGRNSGLHDLALTPDQIDIFIRGLRLSSEGKESPYDLQKIGPSVQAFVQKKQQLYLAKLKQDNIAEGTAFFAKLKNNKKIVTLPDGLCYEIVTPGTGDYPKPNQTVRVNYTGLLINGTVFDSSTQHGGPAEFQLDQVIPGWAEGIQKINKGGKIRLYVPSGLAYGDQGNQGIPPAATLIFEVELLDIKNAPPADSGASGTPPPADTAK